MERVNFYSDKKFLHYEMAKYMVNEFNTIMLDGQLYYFNGKVYKNDIFWLKKKMTQLEVTIKETQRQEVLHTLRYISPDRTHSAPNYIAVKNGVIDISNDKLYQHSPKFIITSLIDVNYNSEPFNSEIDNLFDTLSDGDEEIIKLLKEIIGYTLYRSNFLGKAFLLKGEGGNGKSTFLKAIYGLLGNENISSLSITELGNRFNTGLLKEKLANIGDDIPYWEIKDTSIFKKLTTGEMLKGESKNDTPFFFENYSKLIFSANRIPKIRDQSQGFKDRFVIVPFNARIRNSSKEDPFFIHKITSDSAKEYLLKIGIYQLKKLIQKQQFTIPEVVKDEVKEFNLNNNIVSLWLENYIEMGGNEYEIIIRDAYIDYVNFIKENGIKEQITKKAFAIELKLLGYEQTKKYVRTGNVQTQVRAYVK